MSRAAKKRVLRLGAFCVAAGGAAGPQAPGRAVQGRRRLLCPPNGRAAAGAPAGIVCPKLRACITFCRLWYRHRPHSSASWRRSPPLSRRASGLLGRAACGLGGRAQTSGVGSLALASSQAAGPSAPAPSAGVACRALDACEPSWAMQSTSRSAAAANSAVAGPPHLEAAGRLVQAIRRTLANQDCHATGITFLSFQE